MYGGWGDDFWRGEKADIRMLSFCFSTTLTALLHERKDKRNIHTRKYVHHIWSTAYGILLKLQYCVHCYRHPNVVQVVTYLHHCTKSSHIHYAMPKKSGNDQRHTIHNFVQESPQIW